MTTGFGSGEESGEQEEEQREDADQTLVGGGGQLGGFSLPLFAAFCHDHYVD